MAFLLREAEPVVSPSGPSVLPRAQESAAAQPHLYPLVPGLSGQCLGLSCHCLGLQPHWPLEPLVLLPVPCHWPLVPLVSMPTHWLLGPLVLPPAQWLRSSKFCTTERCLSHIVFEHRPQAPPLAEKQSLGSLLA